jgi:hypothetical protein
VITEQQYFAAHINVERPSDPVRVNARALLASVNALLEYLDYSPALNSGWRTASYNAKVPGAAKKSKHITGEAIDLDDSNGALRYMLTEHPQLLVQFSLFMEHPASTKGWCHLQSVGPQSGKRIFYP